MCSKRCWSLFFKAVLVLLAVVLDPTDIYTDLALGIQFIREGDTNWAVCTFVFLLVPYVLQLCFFCCFGCSEMMDDNKVLGWIFIFMSAIGLGPVAMSIDSLIDFYKGKQTDAVDGKMVTSLGRFVIIILENLPQLALQVYVVGRRNHADPLVVAALATSFLSASKGILSVAVDAVVNKKKIELSLVQELVYNITLLPMIALMVLCSFPTLSLYSSLVTHTHPAHLAVLIYFLLHVLATSFLLTTSKKEWFNLSPAFIRFLTFFLQLVFFVICNLLIMRWFISVVPLLPSSHQNSTSIPTTIPGIPSFIWPEPLPLLKTWIYPFQNSATLPDWANCSVAGEQLSSQINDASNNTITTAWKSMQSGFCITNHSDTIVKVLSSCTFILIGWHFILLFIYPTIHSYVWEGNKPIEDDDENANTTTV